MSDKSVWVVSSGTYSDYRVLCAAPSKAAAMKARLVGDPELRQRREVGSTTSSAT